MESLSRSSTSDSALLDESEKDFENGHDSDSGRRKGLLENDRIPWWEHWSLRLLVFAVYSLTLLFLPNPLLFHTLDQYSTYTPAREAIKFQKVTYDQGLHTRNRFRGEPRPEVEESWKRLIKNFNLRFTAEEVQKLNTTALALEGGGGFYGQLNVYHHLHCLKVLRHVTWQEVYNISMVDVREHADHCIDSIRHALMCYPDLTAYTFNWHDGERLPLPEWNVSQTCADWDAIDAWATEKAFSLYDEKTLIHPTYGVLFSSEDGDFERM